MCHVVVFPAPPPLPKFYTAGPPIPPPTVDDGGGSTPDYISGLGSVSGSISGFGSGDNYDGANFVDDEDFVNRHKRGKRLS